MGGAAPTVMPVVAASRTVAISVTDAPTVRPAVPDIATVPVSTDGPVAGERATSMPEFALDADDVPFWLPLAPAVTCTRSAHIEPELTAVVAEELLWVERAVMTAGLVMVGGALPEVPSAPANHTSKSALMAVVIPATVMVVLAELVCPETDGVGSNPAAPGRRRSLLMPVPPHSG